MTHSEPTVAMVASQREWALAFAIRGAVFVAEQGVAVELEWDEHDEHAQQLLAWRFGQPIGVGRLVVLDGVGRIGRLAVLPQARGAGTGVALVRGLEDLARDQGLTVVELHAQRQAVAFYERLGYRAEGPEFDDAGIPHRHMRSWV